MLKNRPKNKNHMHGFNVEDGSNVSETLKQTVDQIWYVYDQDGNNELDFDEAGEFIAEYMEVIGLGKDHDRKTLREILRSFDEDKSETIDK